MKYYTGIRLTRSVYPQKRPTKSIFYPLVCSLVCILGDFRSDRFSDDKTGIWHFQGIVPNIFMRKSIVPRRIRGLSTILAYFRFLTIFRR